MDTEMRKNRRLMQALDRARRKKNVPESHYLTQMRDENNAVEFRHLRTCFFTDSGIVRSVDGVSFDVPLGKTVAVVGESGCGKSVTSLSLLQLLQRPQGQITGGEIRLNLGDKAYDIVKTPEKVMAKLRGGAVSMIFQEPMTALNPVLRIGEQVGEAVALHSDLDKAAVKERVLELLEQVGISNSRGVYNMYPHSLSGGMRQRVVIAMALASKPRLIIADEPTTALDVTIQAQILSLLKKLKEAIGSAVLLITHDLAVVAGMADFVVVMYAGRVVEQGTVREIFHNPVHPYTRGLLASKPVVGKRVETLYSIPGKVPDPGKLPAWCYFRDRCSRGGCCEDYPEEIAISPTHRVSCHRWQEEENSDEKGR